MHVSSLPLIETLGRGYVSFYIRTFNDSKNILLMVGLGLIVSPDGKLCLVLGLGSCIRIGFTYVHSKVCLSLVCLQPVYIGLTMHEQCWVTYMPPTSKFNILMMRLLLAIEYIVIRKRQKLHCLLSSNKYDKIFRSSPDPTPSQVLAGRRALAGIQTRAVGHVIEFPGKCARDKPHGVLIDTVLVSFNVQSYHECSKTAVSAVCCSPTKCSILSLANKCSGTWWDLNMSRWCSL